MSYVPVLHPASDSDLTRNTPPADAWRMTRSADAACASRPGCHLRTRFGVCATPSSNRGSGRLRDQAPAGGVPERQPDEHRSACSRLHCSLIAAIPWARLQLCRSSRANPRVPRAAVWWKRNRGSALLKRSGTDSVLSPRGDEAPGNSGAVVTDLSMQPVRQGVDLDVILGRDSELCDLGQNRAN
jgi:hypothetical protein